jgi:hypothetical protein
MAIRQITVELENAPGKLAKLSGMLGAEGVNIRAISVADASSETALIRIIADDPSKAVKVLRGHRYICREREVIAVETPDHPGGLSAVVKPLAEAAINVQYLYGYLGRVGGNCILILSVDKTDEAVEMLKRNWVHVLGDELYNL